MDGALKELFPIFLCFCLDFPCQFCLLQIELFRQKTGKVAHMEFLRLCHVIGEDSGGEFAVRFFQGIFRNIL